MLNATPLPIDDYGNPQPVGCHKTRGTQAITLTSNAVVYASTAFSSTTKTLASIELGAAGTDTLTLTAKAESWEGEEVSVQVAGAAGTLSVAVTGKAILITPTAASTVKEVVEAIEANYQANELVSCTYTNDGSAVIDATQAKAYLNGWDAGNRGVYVRIWCDNDCFIGTFAEAETATKTASMPLTAKCDHWEFVFPGHKIAAKSATSGAIIYMTPAKQM